jgi:parallel beta helix pectate lyase-like protein
MTTRFSTHIICRPILAFIAVSFFAAPGAHAQAVRMFVASYGNDANDGSRGSPKRNFQAAHDAVASDGQIVVLDTAGYGALNITKALTVTVPPGVNGFITVTGSSNGITINGPSNIGVVLRGLIIEGGGQNAGGSGVFASKAVNLVLDDCKIRSFNSGVQQSTPGSSTSLNDCLILGCFYGFDLFIASGPDVSANVSRCRFELNGEVALDAHNSNYGGTVLVSVADSIFYRNKFGIVATLIPGSGSTSNVFVSNCVITNNATGVSGNGSTGNGLVFSRGNNTLLNNAAGNTFGGSFSAQ